MSEYTKYIDSLIKMDEIVARSADITTPIKHHKIVSNEESEYTMLHTLWDELYTFVYANFKMPESKTAKGATSKDGVTVTPEVEAELSSMKEMFVLSRKEIEEQLYEIPPVILEQCFPVWMARFMLRFANVPVIPLNLATFNKFQYMYGYMYNSFK